MVQRNTIYSQEEAEQKAKEKGFELLGEYKGRKIETEVRCPYCKTPFKCKLGHIFSGNTKSCGCIKSQRIKESKTIKEQDAKDKCYEAGTQMIGFYKGSHNKTVFQCKYCMTPFVTTPSLVWGLKTTSCGCYYREKRMFKLRLSQKGAEERVEKTGFKLIGNYTNNHTRTLFECKYCDTKFESTLNNITSGQVKSCGCKNYEDSSLTIEEVKKRCEDAGLKLIGEYFGTQTKTEFLCPYCNTSFITKPEYVFCGDTKSCGCQKSRWAIEANLYTEEEAKQKCLDVGIQMIGKYKGGNEETEFICNNCKNPFLCIPISIWSGNTKSCGNCGFYRNGVKTSLYALGIHHLIDPNEEFSYHNHQLEKYNVDIFIPFCNLVIEVDGFYWHDGFEERDNKKDAYLIEKGYKILRVKGGCTIPQKSCLERAIFDTLFSKEFKKVLVLDEKPKNKKSFYEIHNNGV